MQQTNHIIISETNEMIGEQRQIDVESFEIGMEFFFPNNNENNNKTQFHKMILTISCIEIREATNFTENNNISFLFSIVWIFMMANNVIQHQFKD